MAEIEAKKKEEFDREIEAVKKEYEEKQKAKREKRKNKDKEKDKEKEKESKSKDEEEDKQDEKAKEDKVKQYASLWWISSNQYIRSRSLLRAKRNQRQSLALASFISTST